MKLIDEATRIVMQKPEFLHEAIKDKYCPHEFGLESKEDSERHCNKGESCCDICWEREFGCNPDVEEKNTDPIIMDSGERREFSSGAVRDIAEGKGRCDLLPLVEASIMCCENKILRRIGYFMETKKPAELWSVLTEFCEERGWMWPTMLLEVSIQMEEDAKKNGEHAWEKEIPTSVYINSAVYHYLKWQEGEEEEERHDRAFCRDILCLVWTARRYWE